MNAMETMLEIETLPGRDNERVLTLVLHGELSLDELRCIGEQLLQLATRGLRNVVLDFTEVDHLDYRGLAPLAARAELLRRAGGDIKVAALSGYLAHIFRAAGAHELFQFFADPANARASFAEAAPPTE